MKAPFSSQYSYSGKIVKARPIPNGSEIAAKYCNSGLDVNFYSPLIRYTRVNIPIGYPLPVGSLRSEQNEGAFWATQTVGYKQYHDPIWLWQKCIGGPIGKSCPLLFSTGAVVRYYWLIVTSLS